MTPKEKGIQLMADMGTAVVAKMSGPSMPDDSALLGALKDTAKSVSDYTEKAADCVTDMANKLLSAVKDAITKKISKKEPEVPKPADIQQAINDAIEAAKP